MGMGCEEAKTFYHISYQVPSWKYENMSGKYQGILRGQKLGQSVGTLSAFPLAQYYGGVRAAISIIHL